MKKRIVCAFLTLIMMVSLANTAIVTASADSSGTSEGAITVLKKMMSKQDYCYQVGKTDQFRTGYGTVCTSKHYVNSAGDPCDAEGNPTTYKHYISEKQADAALRTALGEIDQKVDTYASNNGLRLSQAQNDALNIFVFIYGSEWMSGTSSLTTLLKSKPTYPLLRDALRLVSNDNSDRCGLIANMYVNGVYSNNLPTNYVDITYDPASGSIAQTATPGESYKSMYDPSVGGSHLVTASRTGYQFLGWFSGTPGDWTYCPKLPAATSAVTLTALWQKKGVTYANMKDGSYAIYCHVAKGNLASTNVFTKPENTSENLLRNNKGNVVKVTDLYPSVSVYDADRFFLDASGNKWIRVAECRWVMVSGTAVSGSSTTSGASISVITTVTNAYVNARQSASAASALVGTYTVGQQLRIINTTVVGGVTWGQVARSETDDTPVAWVCLLYTNWGEVGVNATPSTSGVSVATATIAAYDYVNVRNTAGTDGQIVGALKRGDSVSIYEIATVNGLQWGRTDAGWFCLNYANVTMKNGDSIGLTASGEGALAYALSVTVSGNPDVYVKASTQVDKWEDVDSDSYYDPAKLKNSSSVTVTNMVVDAGGNTWVKVVWSAKVERVVDKKNVVKTVSKTGWIMLGGSELTDSSAPLAMKPLEFKTAGDVTVRKESRSDSEALFTMNAGVSIQVTEVKLGEPMWGFTYSDVNNPYSTGGWIILSGSYLTRTNAPTVVTTTTSSSTGKMATIINADSVNVRSACHLYAPKVGTVSRGTTAAILEIENDWYRLDLNVANNSKTENWVYKDYVQVTDVVTSTDSTTTVVNSDGTTTTTNTVGTGIVANTYQGVNVRSGAGIGYAQVAKLLPGTSVEILEVVTVGSSKWGRCAQGWVCMDYITMVSSTTTTTTATNGNGTPVSSFDNVQTSSVTAVYTGKVNKDVTVCKAPEWRKDDVNSDPSNDPQEGEIVCTLSAGTPITMYEIVKVTEIKSSTNGVDNGNGSVGTVSETTYWARINEGYIYNPMSCVELDTLNEKVYTLTAADSLNVREEATVSSNVVGTLRKGDQVKVTALKIVDYDKIWGKIDYDETAEGHDNDRSGWIRLDAMSEGAYYIQNTTTNTVTNNYAAAQPSIGSTGNTTTVTGATGTTGGYLYTGKVINTNQVNVRQKPSTTAAVTTTLKSGQALVIYETTIADAMAWGRCDAGWVYLYYVDLTPTTPGVLDARVVYNDNTIIYSDANGTSTVGTYTRMAVVDIYEIVGKMARTDQGWVHTDNLL